MPKEKDPFWRYVTFLNEYNSKWRCNFCKQEYGGGATRIKAHLAGIGGFGIKGCERVDVNVRAEAREVMMPKKVMDSSDRGVSEERIRRNVRAAPTSTSDPPNVEGGTNLQFPQGVPPLTPQTRGWMEEMVQAVREVDIANLPLDGAASYSSAYPPPNSFFSNSPNEMSTLFTESLDLGTSNAQQNPGAPLPSPNSQLLDNIFQNELQGSILPVPIASDTHLSNMSTTNTPQHSNQPDQSFHGQCGHGTGLSPPWASMDIEPPIPSQPFNEPLIFEALNSSLQIPEDIIDTLGPSTSEGMPIGAPAGASSFQYDRLLDVGNSNCFLDCNRPHISCVTSVTNTVPQSNKPLPSCNEECGTETRSFPLQESMDIYPLTVLQPTRGPHFFKATHVDLQVLEGGANMAGPSSSQGMPKGAPAGASSFQYDRLLDVGNSNWFLDSNRPRISSVTSDSHIIEATNVELQVPEVATNATGPSSSQDMNRASPIMNVRSTYANDEEIRNLKRKVEELNDKAAVIKEQMEIESASSSVRKKPRILVERWLKETGRAGNNCQIIGQANAETLPLKEQVETLTREVEKLIEQTFPQTPLMEGRDAKGVKFLERKLTGEAILRNIELIWDRLKENHACKLGICGMGGVGKTTIMMHIHNRLLEDATFDGVVFTTVSQDFSIYKLQSDIWKALKFGIMKDEHEKRRATMLSEQLERKKNCVLILDDVWEHFDLEEVGIPVRADGLKLVLTTRSFHVCRQMRCQEKIKIEPLSQKEAESLFLEELGTEVPLNLEIEAIVKSIVEECAGLPIGVITMARSMRGVTDVFEWRDSLVKLKESSMGQTDMGKKVLMNLKFSYDRLDNPDIQQCFLSCALYPEDQFIDKFELIKLFIDQGLIGGLSSMRKEQYDRGLTILNKLRNVCLLEDHWNKMKMHDLIRDMALHIMSATSIVKAGKSLRSIPPEEYWTDALEKVSLMQNDIVEFPLNMSPNCPKLSTLLLNDSLKGDNVIPDSFFKNLWGLKVLNLSRCSLTNLPNSISDLVNLRALLLGGCRKLRRIPYLGKLASLTKLDARGCDLLEAPEGLGMLMKLQYLKIGAVNGEDITKLKALEILECYFEDADDFNKCVRVIAQSNPCYYNLSVAGDESRFKVKIDDDARFGNRKRAVSICGWSHAIVSVGRECAGIFILIPLDVQELDVVNCDGTTNLFGRGSLEDLEDLRIENLENLRVLCGGQDEELNDVHDSPAPTPTPLHFPSLGVLSIYECPKLKFLFGHGSKFYLPHLREIEISDCEEMVGIMAAVTSLPLPPPPAFPSLEEISIQWCDKMKRVVESEWLPYFPNLRRIEVSFCENMEEIIGVPPLNMTVEETSLEFVNVRSCNNMRMLLPQEFLLHLRNLQSIDVDCCKGMVEIIGGAGQGQEGSIMTPVSNIPSSFQSSISLPKLNNLCLYGLPQLKSICEVPISCDSMGDLIVYKCPELKGIPLHLHLRDVEKFLYIWVEDEEKWETLMWDHPDAQAILQPYLLRGEFPCTKLSSSGERPYSPNAIELFYTGEDLLRLCSALEESPAARACLPAIPTQVAI